MGKINFIKLKIVARFILWIIEDEIKILEDQIAENELGFYEKIKAKKILDEFLDARRMAKEALEK